MSTTQLRPDEAVAAPPRNRRRILAIVAVGIIAVAVLVTWLVAFSPVFGVHTVQVRGANILGEARIRRAASVQDGTPLVHVDTRAIATRVESLDVVASAQVSTSFPNTVIITVTERRAVGYVNVGGRHELVDRSGFQYLAVGKKPRNLPRFVVPAGTDGRTTGGAVATVAAALPAPVLAEVTSIEALDPQAISLVLRHDRVVQWGSAARSADKAQVLAVLVKRHVSQIDVTDPDRPFTR